MFARLTFLLAMILGLAVGPVQGLSACAVARGEPSCQRCCADAGMACCVNPNTPHSPAAPAKIATFANDGKQVTPPALALLCLVAPRAVEPPFVDRQHAARMPAPPVLDRTCIRLV